MILHLVFAFLSLLLTPFALAVESDITTPDLDTLEKSAVHITARHPGRLKHGSGFVVAQEYVLTNYHFMLTDTDSTVGSIKIRWADSSSVLKAEVLWHDRDLDLALLHVEDLSLPSVILVNQLPAKGDKVWVVSFSGATEFGVEKLAARVNDGTVNRTREWDWNETRALAIQHSATLNPGDSGSLLVDHCYRVVGVNTSRPLDPATRGVFFALSIREVIPYLESKGIPLQKTEIPCPQAGGGGTTADQKAEAIQEAINQKVEKTEEAIQKNLNEIEEDKEASQQENQAGKDGWGIWLLVGIVFGLLGVFLLVAHKFLPLSAIGGKRIPEGERGPDWDEDGEIPRGTAMIRWALVGAVVVVVFVEVIAWSRVPERMYWHGTQCSEIKEMRAYLEKYPQGLYEQEAHECLADAQSHQLFAEIFGRNASTVAKNADGLTDLHYAAAANMTRLARLLLDSGANVHARIKDDKKLLSETSENKLRQLSKTNIFDNFLSSGDTPLHFAVANNARATAELLLSRRADARSKDKYGWTPLHTAAWYNARTTAELLLSRGADVAARSNAGWTPLHTAAWHNARATAELLLSRGADVAAKHQAGNTPLHTAARNNARAAAELLLSHGADVAAKNQAGKTPLHLAVRENARTTAELLLSHGADVRAKTNTGSTPLRLAEQENARATAELLRRHGADVDARFREVFGRNASPSAENADGLTDLHYAAAANMTRLARFLLDSGANVHTRIKDDQKPLSETSKRKLRQLSKTNIFDNFLSSGDTPLHFAAASNARAAAELLLSRGADVTAKDKDGRIPLHTAASHDARATAELLLSNGADVAAKNQVGNTPLHLAAQENARTTAELLLSHGADVHAKTNAGSTPLRLAEQENARATAELLRRHGGGVDARFREVFGRNASPSAKNADGLTDLHYAAAANMTRLARFLLDSGANVHTRIKDDQKPLSETSENKLRQLSKTNIFDNFLSSGDTPLHFAAANNARATAELLLSRGADVAAKAKDGWTPLHTAARNNARETAELLLSSGADIAAKNQAGKTPLHLAVQENARTTAELLLSHGADAHIKANAGSTSLPLAEQENARAAAGLLPKHETDVDARFHAVFGRNASHSAKNADGLTDLHYAAAANMTRLARFLLDSGANVHTRIKNDQKPLSETSENKLRQLSKTNAFDNFLSSGDTPLHFAAANNARTTAELLLSRSADVRAKARNGRTPLHLAAWNNARATAELLLSRGADINAKTKDGSTSLHSAAANNARATAELLLSRGADVRAKAKDGSTSLHSAAANNARATAELLLSRGADVAAKAKDGWTPLHTAARNNARATAELLLSNGADVAAKAKDGWTPLHRAGWYDARATAKLLLSSGADVAAKDKNGWTSLHTAAQENARATAELLLSSGADVAAKDNAGWTPLHWAAWNNARATAELLLSGGADVHAKTKDGWTPLRLAVRSHARETVELLRKHEANVDARLREVFGRDAFIPARQASRQQGIRAQ